jgi:hypothetical protein
MTGPRSLLGFFVLTDSVIHAGKGPAESHLGLVAQRRKLRGMGAQELDVI